jgi:hypothetical protein
MGKVDMALLRYLDGQPTSWQTQKETAERCRSAV